MGLSALYYAVYVIKGSNNEADMYMEQAWKARRMGENKTATGLYDQAIKAGRETWVAYFYRGECKLDAGDTEGAIADFMKATEIDPKHSKQAKTALEKALALQTK